MKELTMRQQECLLLVKHFHRSYGRSPKRVELARAMGLKHHATATFHLRALERKGRVRLRLFSSEIEVIK